MAMQLELFRSPAMVRTRLVAQSIWKNRWFGWVIIAVFALWYLWWCFHIPSPAKAATVLAVIAAIMAYRGEPEGFEKLFWTLVLFAFLLVELTAIDRKEYAEKLAHDADVKKQDSQFTDIGTGIKTGVQGILDESHRQFEKTIEDDSKHFDATMALEKEGIDQITGGTSYIVVDAVPSPTQPENDNLALLITLCDKCVDSVTAHIYMREGPPGGKQSPEVMIFDGTLDTNGLWATKKITPSQVGLNQYYFQILARNKPTDEVMHVRFNWTKRTWETSWITTRQLSRPQYNPKTGMAEGMTNKFLERKTWHTVPTAHLNPKTIKDLP
jgi:hypothetical protein